MAPILAFGSRMFRTRAAARDMATDLDRWNSVRAAVLQAIEDACRERDGLQRRVEGYQMRTANLLDNATEFAERPAAEEETIRSAERQMVAGLARINQVAGHIDSLRAVLATIEGQRVAERQSA